MKLITIKDSIIFKEDNRSIERKPNIFRLEYVTMPKIGTITTELSLNANFKFDFVIEKLHNPLVWASIKDSGQEYFNTLVINSMNFYKDWFEQVNIIEEEDEKLKNIRERIVEEEEKRDDIKTELNTDNDFYDDERLINLRRVIESLYVEEAKIIDKINVSNQKIVNFIPDLNSENFVLKNKVLPSDVVYSLFDMFRNYQIKPEDISYTET